MRETFARSEFEAPLGRIDKEVGEAIASLGKYSTSAVWQAAVTATVSTHRAPKHLVRAQLVLLGHLAGGGAASGPAVERFAAGVELLHLFMLVHDDVMDGATIRRGRPALRVSLAEAAPSVTWQTGRDLAILIGNALSVLALGRLAPGSHGGEEAWQTMLDACLSAGAGQFQDLLGIRSLDGNGPEPGQGTPAQIESALRTAIVHKTATPSFAAPFAAGLLLAKPGADTTAARTWGETVGVAFQAVDDLSDLVVPPHVTGKDALRDLLEGRAALPLLLLRERAEGEDAELLESLMGKQVIVPAERAALDRLITKTGVVEACAGRVRDELTRGAEDADKAGFPEAAREGMRVLEKRLLRHLEDVVKAAKD